ncbi:PhoH family protein [Candidatus Saccharibacteria bacterium]|nr:PhoH family protein [Candidatus Saccharibacteria bacterium]
MSKNDPFRRPQYQTPVPNYQRVIAKNSNRHKVLPLASGQNQPSTSHEYHPCIVPGLDVLIGDPDILAPENKDVKRKADYLFIPIGYLDRLNDFYNELSSRGEASRQIVKRIGQIRLEMNRKGADEYTCKNGMKIIFQESDLSTKSSKLQAVNLAKALQRQNGKGQVAIMSGSDPLIATAAMADIDVARVNPDIYTGRRIIDLPAALKDSWGVQRFLSKEQLKLYLNTPLQLNEYVELKFGGQTVTRRGHFDYVGRFTGKGVEPLRYEKINHPAYRSILPRTAGQAMLLDALLAPVDEIAVIIVIGTFGTGKTFLTTAAGLSGCEAGMYERVVVCPSDGNLGKDIGAVPGDTTRKTLVKARPITDNLREILWIRNDAPSEETPPEADAFAPVDKQLSRKKQRKLEKQQDAVKRAPLGSRVDDITDKYFTFIPLIELQGRTIPRSFIIMDEFENTERYQARGMLSRIGDYSKIVALGDPFQVNNPHLNDTSNGLSYAATKLGGKPYVAVVTLHESEVTRSAAAQTIAKYLR